MRLDVPYFSIYSVQRQTILPTTGKWVTHIAACCPPDFYSYSIKLNQEIFFLLYCRFLQVVAYRQFTRMIHSKLKDRRIPLPACAYTAIHFTHSDECKGYDDLETDDESL